MATDPRTVLQTPNLGTPVPAPADVPGGCGDGAGGCCGACGGPTPPLQLAVPRPDCADSPWDGGLSPASSGNPSLDLVAAAIAASRQRVLEPLLAAEQLPTPGIAGRVWLGTPGPSINALVQLEAPAATPAQARLLIWSSTDPIPVPSRPALTCLIDGRPRETRSLPDWRAVRSTTMAWPTLPTTWRRRRRRPTPCTPSPMAAAPRRSPTARSSATARRDNCVTSAIPRAAAGP